MLRVLAPALQHRTYLFYMLKKQIKQLYINSIMKLKNRPNKRNKQIYVLTDSQMIYKYNVSSLLLPNAVK